VPVSEQNFPGGEIEVETELEVETEFEVGSGGRVLERDGKVLKKDLMLKKYCELDKVEEDKELKER